MLVKWRVLVMLVCLSGLLLGGLSWQRRQWNQEKQADYARLAWWLRRGDDEARLTPARRAYLGGRFAECLNLLQEADSKGERDLRSAAFLALLYDVPWPEQVVGREQIEAHKTRPRLLARAVETGYLADRGKLRLDLLVWKDGKLQNLPAARAVARDDEWREIDELAVVHLDRKDEGLSQLYVHGRTRGGRQRVDVIYGSTDWKRWTLLQARDVKRLKDRVEVAKGNAYKLFEDEWVELKR